MSETTNKITPQEALNTNSPLVLTAALKPVGGLDRFQPAGFPEVGHVIYKAPRPNDTFENVCIVDSAASMANHLESVCMRGPHDYELVEELNGMPYLRCVTGDLTNGHLPLDKREVIVTSLTEGHRIASTYFLEGKLLDDSGQGGSTGTTGGKGKDTPQAKEGTEFHRVLCDAFGIVGAGAKRPHLPAERWWSVFKAIFRYDPNALVHGVLFPQWQIKIPRVLTAHLEAFGAARVDRSGVKFDRLGKTTSGQPIFAVDEATAREIRATFIIDVALVRSFGRTNGGGDLGLTDPQKEFLVALALWKIKRLLERPFRFRSGCYLECESLKQGENRVEIDVDIRQAIQNAAFENPCITDIYWSRDELYRDAEQKKVATESDASDGGADNWESD